MSDVWNRIKTNPVLVTAVVLAIANLLGMPVDVTLTQQIVETLILILGGVITRLFTRSKASLGDE
jgi:hypothetical protein